MDASVSVDLPATDFVLSDVAPVSIEAVPIDLQRWQPPSHLGLCRPALVLLAGERLSLPVVQIQADTVLQVEFAPGLPKISDDGMTLRFLAVVDGTSHELITSVLSNEQNLRPRTLTLELGYLPAPQASIVIEAGAGPQNDPSADWAAIISLVVGPSDQVSVLKARSFREVRTANEMSHFAAVYDHALFAARDRKARGEEEPVAEATAAALPGEHVFSWGMRLLNRSLQSLGWDRRTGEVQEEDLAGEDPLPGEHVFAWGMRLLTRSFQTLKPPKFATRLREKGANGRRLKMASLCAGTAQIEAGLIRAARVPVDLTLVDISDKLIDKARSYMPPTVKTRLLVQDVNKLELKPDSFDIIACVSGIHHAVELERIWQQVRGALRADGELWLIGEQIGANGNRLAPADCRVANKVFQSLPEKYRLNAQTKVVDQQLPNVDCSEATFEGIRSADIESTLGRFFTPVHVYKRNCFLWMLLNQTYSENYDLALKEDRAIVKSLVKAEMEHFMGGGTPTELHAVYKPMR